MEKEVNNKTSILNKAKEWREVEALLKIIESNPRGKEAGEARDEVLKIAKKWKESGDVHSALSLYKRLLKTDEQFLKGGRLPKASINRMWGIAPSWGRQEGVSRKRTGPPIDVGLLGIITWPVALGRAVLEKIKEQVDRELEPKTKLEEELLELKMRREMEDISEEDYKIGEIKLKRLIKDIEEKEKK